jgi:hypothetical protein
MLTQSEALRVLRELEQEISRKGYDQAEKRHLAWVFNVLKLRLGDGALYGTTRLLKEVQALQKKWQDDRVNAHGGADTIGEILEALRAKYIPELATVRPPAKKEYFPPMFPAATPSATAIDDAVERALAKRGVSV